MIHCKNCGGLLIEENNRIPVPDTFYYKEETINGVLYKIPICETKYPEGFCSCGLEDEE